VLELWLYERGGTISRSGLLSLLIDRITGRDGHVGLLLMGPLGEQRLSQSQRREPVAIGAGQLPRSPSNLLGEGGGLIPESLSRPDGVKPN
jgi:hypothetical protein